MFDLKAAKAGHPVCVRTGEDVEIFAFDINNIYPIVGRVKYRSGAETVACGAWPLQDHYGLF